MCGFCEGREQVIRQYTLTDNEKIETSVSIQPENQSYSVRVRKGSIGYSMPIMANYCMFCGKKLLGGFL